VGGICEDIPFAAVETRLGEKKPDRIRNRNDRNDKVLYTRAYFDDKPADVHAQMVIDAKDIFGEDFHLCSVSGTTN
jgi:hypothetical protein